MPASAEDLLLAVHANQTSRVREMLTAKDSPNIDLNYCWIGGTGYYSLHCAIANGNFELVKLLLQHGADPSKVPDGKDQNDFSESPIYQALTRKDSKMACAILEKLKPDQLTLEAIIITASFTNLTNVVKVALSLAKEKLKFESYYPDTGYYALHCAIENKNLDIVRMLLANGANPNQGSDKKNVKPVLQALNLSQPDIVLEILRSDKFIPDKETIENIVLTASYLNYTEVVKEVLLLARKHNMSIDLNGWTCGPSGHNSLYCAIENKNFALVKLLLENGADPNQTPQKKVSKDDSVSPILYAINLRQPGIALEILKNGKFIPDKETIERIVLAACLLNYTDVAQEILALARTNDISVDVNFWAYPDSGHNSLHCAMAHKNFQLVSWLVDNGANPYQVPREQNEKNIDLMPIMQLIKLKRFKLVLRALENSKIFKPDKTVLENIAAAGVYFCNRELVSKVLEVAANSEPKIIIDLNMMLTVNINNQNKNCTMLDIAIIKQDLPMIELLLNHNAQTSLNDNNSQVRQAVQDALNSNLQIMLAMAKSGFPLDSKEGSLVLGENIFMLDDDTFAGSERYSLALAYLMLAGNLAASETLQANCLHSLLEYEKGTPSKPLGMHPNLSLDKLKALYPGFDVAIQNSGVLENLAKIEKNMSSEFRKTINWAQIYLDLNAYKKAESYLGTVPKKSKPEFYFELAKGFIKLAHSTPVSRHKQAYADKAMLYFAKAAARGNEQALDIMISDYATKLNLPQAQFFVGEFLLKTDKAKALPYLKRAASAKNYEKAEVAEHMYLSVICVDKPSEVYELAKSGNKIAFRVLEEQAAKTTATNELLYLLAKLLYENPPENSAKAKTFGEIVQLIKQGIKIGYAPAIEFAEKELAHPKKGNSPILQFALAEFYMQQDTDIKSLMKAIFYATEAAAQREDGAFDLLTTLAQTRNICAQQAQIAIAKLYYNAGMFKEAANVAFNDYKFKKGNGFSDIDEIHLNLLNTEARKYINPTSLIPYTHACFKHCQGNKIALTSLVKLADDGVKSAQFLLGCYYCGKGNTQEGRAHFKLAAKHYKLAKRVIELLDKPNKDFIANWEKCKNSKTALQDFVECYKPTESSGKLFGGSKKHPVYEQLLAAAADNPSADELLIRIDSTASQPEAKKSNHLPILAFVAMQLTGLIPQQALQKDIYTEIVSLEKERLSKSQSHN